MRRVDAGPYTDIFSGVVDTCGHEVILWFGMACQSLMGHRTLGNAWVEYNIPKVSPSGAIHTRLNASNVSLLAIADAKDRSALNQARLEMSIRMEEVPTNDGKSLQNEEKRCVKKSVS